MSLRFVAKALPHPFASDPGVANEIWGEVRLIHEADERTMELLYHQWDLLKLAEWMVVDGCGFATVLLPDRPKMNESLSEALSRMTQRPDDSFVNEAESDTWFESLHAFRKAHSIRFALRGADVPEVIIGINNGAGEISRYEGERWVFRFQVDEFIVSATNAVRNVIESSLRCAPADESLRETLSKLNAMGTACSKLAQ